MRAKNIFIPLLCSLLIIFLILSCRISSERTTDCPIENLFISTSDLPGSQWQEQGARSYRDAPVKIGNDRAGTSYLGPGGNLINQSIHQFGEENESITGYMKLVDYWHSFEPEDAAWSTLIIPEDISINANEYNLECANAQGIRTCIYIARYEKTVIEFKTYIDLIKVKDLFDIIKIIDHKAQSCITSKNH